jgi:hypothetical protein
MSRVGVRSLSPSCTTPAPDLRSLVTSFGAVAGLVKGMAGAVGPMLSGLKTPCMPGMPSAATACCAIPEQDCPPRCVCEITWEATRGERLRCTVRVTNTSATARTFTVTATGFAGPAGSTEGPTVTPGQLQLGGGSAGLVDVAYTVPEKVENGEYLAEVVVKGAYEQCVSVALTVSSKEVCQLGETRCRCEVRQGDPPVRVRAHHWYDHFQCTEPCTTRTPRQRDTEREREPA